jgi:hypothetical protein
MIKQNFYIILFFLLFIILAALSYKSFNIEGLGGSNDIIAFDIPNLKKWSFPDSVNWYKLVKSRQYKFSELGFTMPNNKLSISFLYTCLEGAGWWRNILRFSNNADGSDGVDGRNPGLWVWPVTGPHVDPNKLHFRVSSNSSWNDGLDTINLPLGVTMLITFVIDQNTIYFYKDNILVSTSYFNNLKPRSYNTSFFVNADGDIGGKVLIKNLTFYDGALSQTDINNMYDTLNGSNSSQGDDK